MPPAHIARMKEMSLDQKWAFIQQGKDMIKQDAVSCVCLRFAQSLCACACVCAPAVCAQQGSLGVPASHIARVKEMSLDQKWAFIQQGKVRIKQDAVSAVSAFRANLSVVWCLSEGLTEEHRRSMRRGSRGVLISLRKMPDCRGRFAQICVGGACA